MAKIGFPELVRECKKRGLPALSFLHLGIERLGCVIWLPNEWPRCADDFVVHTYGEGLPTRELDIESGDWVWRTRSVDVKVECLNVKGDRHVIDTRLSPLSHFRHNALMISAYFQQMEDYNISLV